MSDSAGRSTRGRARSTGRVAQNQPGGGGRASRGPPTAGGAWGPRPTSSGPAPQRPQAAPAWGPRPTAPMPQAYQQRAPAPTPAPGQAGRATKRQGDGPSVVEEVGQLVIGSGGDAGNSAGRGSIRGRRQIDTQVTNLVTRPQGLHTKQGSTGTTIHLTSNYFDMIAPNSKWCLNQYQVDFAPVIDITSTKKRLMREAIKDLLSGYLFDGSMLLTTTRLENMELFVDNAEGEPVRITLTLTKELANGEYDMLRCFNLIIRNCLRRMNLQLVMRNFYDAKASIKVAEYGIELWPGYITSMRQHEDKILLCCEISHKFMRMENILKVLRTVAQRDRDYKAIFNKQVVGTIVLTDYNNRTYRIDDVDWDVSPRSTFAKSDGTSISYVDYYKSRYQLNITEMKQPMLVSRAKEREIRAGVAELIYLVPELCRMTGLTERERGNMSMMRKLDEHTRLGPEGRQNRLLNFSKRMNQNPDIQKELQKWNMIMPNNLVEFKGRVLPSETIIQGRSGEIKYPSGSDTDWTRNLRSNPMLNLGKVNNWVVICDQQNKSAAYTFCQTLRKAASGMSFDLPAPKLTEIYDDKPATYLEGLDRAMQHNPDFILCVASNNKPDRYSAIKKKCCVDKAVPTQVILAKNMMSKGVMSIATKVAIQINCKVGGAPWTLDVPLPKLMVVGFDVCHDTMDKAKSYGAMVSSLDKSLSSLFSTVSAHRNGEELSNDFALNIIKGAKTQAEVTGKLPETIIIYRDGVGDGQIPYVYNHEVKQIEAQLKAFYKEQEFKMVFIVVTKRINTRLFNRNQNPPPGTVVDDVITLPSKYDFYIVSQCVRQGTVAPTSYNVLHDTLNLGPDRLQRLTYKLTHMYYNWSGTVRVPAPCQYAHKLAFLTSQSLHRNPHPRLSRSLYFL